MGGRLQRAGLEQPFLTPADKNEASSPLKKSHKSSLGRALMFLLSVPFLGHPPPESSVRRAGPWLSIPLLPSSFEFWPAMERSWIPKSLLPLVIPHPRLAPRPCTLLPRRFQLPSTPGNTPSALCKHHNSRTYAHMHTHTPKHTRTHARVCYVLHAQAFTGTPLTDVHACAHAFAAIIAHAS